MVCPLITSTLPGNFSTSILVSTSSVITCRLTSPIAVAIASGIPCQKASGGEGLPLTCSPRVKSRSRLKVIPCSGSR